MYGKTPSWFAEQAKILQSQGGKGYYEDVLKANKIGPFAPKVAAPTATVASSFVDTRTPPQISSDKAIFDQAALDDAEMAAYDPNAFNYDNNPSAFNTQENSSSWYDPFSFGDYGQNADSAVLKNGLNADGSAMNSAQMKDQQIGNYYDEMSKNVGTSWNDWANIGLGTVGTAMEIGMYGDKKDFLSNSNKALEQSTANAEEAHNTKLANNASYGSAFSNNA